MIDMGNINWKAQVVCRKTLSDIQVANPVFFGKGKAKIHGDKKYWTLGNKAMTSRYFITLQVNCYSDTQQFEYTVRPLADDYKIGNTVIRLKDLDEVEAYVMAN